MCTGTHNGKHVGTTEPANAKQNQFDEDTASRASKAAITGLHFERKTGCALANVLVDGSETQADQVPQKKAASQHGISPQKYLSDMRREAWGGGPEIVALANSLKRQIVLLEVADAHESNGEEGDAIYLKITARFGPASQRTAIYILSTNQGFPYDYRGKRSNHFLAVFPSQPI